LDVLQPVAVALNFFIYFYKRYCIWPFHLIKLLNYLQSHVDTLVPATLHSKNKRVCLARRDTFADQEWGVSKACASDKRVRDCPATPPSLHCNHQFM
jgi:hypothetical protein